MSDGSPTRDALGRAGRRAAYHLLQAIVEGLRAVEAVIEELGGIQEGSDLDGDREDRQRIDVE